MEHTPTPCTVDVTATDHTDTLSFGRFLFYFLQCTAVLPISTECNAAGCWPPAYMYACLGTQKSQASLPLKELSKGPVELPARSSHSACGQKHTGRRYRQSKTGKCRNGPSPNRAVRHYSRYNTGKPRAERRPTKVQGRLLCIAVQATPRWRTAPLPQLPPYLISCLRAKLARHPNAFAGATSRCPTNACRSGG